MSEEDQTPAMASPPDYELSDRQMQRVVAEILRIATFVGKFDERDIVAYIVTPEEVDGWVESYRQHTDFERKADQVRDFWVDDCGIVVIYKREEFAKDIAERLPAIAAELAERPAPDNILCIVQFQHAGESYFQTVFLRGVRQPPVLS